MNKITKNIKYPLIATAISTIMMLLIYLVNGITPFGNNTILTSDLFHQYAPLLSGFMDKLANGESLLFSINAGLGASFLGNILNYMGSPFNLIVILMGKNYIQESIAIIILLKAILSTFTFTYVLNKFNKNNIFVIASGLLYTFSAFFIAYYWNIMWYDAVYMLPIIALGIHKLIKERNAKLYICALAFSIITNYYMGFMLCITSVILFFAIYFMENDFKDKIAMETKDKKIVEKSLFWDRVLKFTTSSLIVGGLSAFVLIPAFVLLQQSSATSDGFNGLSIDFNPLYLLGNHLAFNTVSFRTGSYAGIILPNIYCGILALVSVPFYFCNKKINKKEKIIAGTIIGFFFLSFTINLLNYIWHGLHFPNDLPYRFSYIYIFFLLLINYRSLSNITNINKKTFVKVIAIGSFLIFPIGLFFAPNRTTLTIVGSVILFAVYGILLYLYTKQPLKKTVPVILSLVLLIELALPCFNSLKTYDKSLYNDCKTDIVEMKEMISSDEFYRMELLNNRTLNDSIIHGYNGISSFSSMNYQHISRLQKYLGIRSNGLNTMQYCAQTPIYNMMFGVNYILDNIDDDKYEPSSNYFNIIGTTTSGNKVYASKYPTSIGFSVVGDVADVNAWNFKTYSPFSNQKSFLKFASGIDNGLTYITSHTFTTNDMDVVYDTENNPNQEFKYTLTGNVGDAFTTIKTTVEEDGTYFAYVLTTDFDVTYDVENRDKTTQSCTNSYIYVYDIGTLSAGSTFTAYITSSAKTQQSGTFNYFVAKVENKAIEDAYNIIKENGIMNVVEYSDNYIKANIDTQTGNIYTSIPYDTNWKVLVDGKEIDDNSIYIVGESLIALKTEIGEHTIEFVYEIPNLMIGTIISSVVLIGCIIALIIEKRRKNAKV